MREIKFRVWMPAHKKTPAGWYKGDALYLSALQNKQYGLSEQNTKLVELSQYTGLEDKNGTPIYEGDIVTMEPHELPFEVRGYAGAFWLKEPHTRRTCLLGNPDSMPVVIGNIYENPELLKEAA